MRLRNNTRDRPYPPARTK